MGRLQLAPSDQVRLFVPLPDGAQERSPEPLDLSAAGGAELVVLRSWHVPPGGSFEVACVKASAQLWVPGLEGAVLAGASAMVRERAGLSVVTPGTTEWVDGHWEQAFGGSASRPDGLAAAGRHVLAFVGDGQEALLCTAVCVAPPPAERCRSLGEGLQIQGQLEPPPEPGLVAATLAAAAGSPRTALGIAGLVLVVALVVLVSRRPRPAW